MRCFFPMRPLLVAAATILSAYSALSEPLSLAPAALLRSHAAGLEIQVSPPTAFTAPEQSLPANGHVRPPVNTSETAPFRILTSGGDTHYYLKLEESGTGRSALTVFVRSGHQVDMRVPFGTYVVKYASGQKWYGYQHLFGPNTAYNKADSTFAFRREGNQIKGFSITLYVVEGGNLTYIAHHPERFARVRAGIEVRTGRLPPELFADIDTPSSMQGCGIAGARSSAVEHYLDMVGVTGSIPVAPTSRRLTQEGVDP